MTASHPLLSPAVAAARLGISAKALRLYEQHDLIAPVRNEAGWRFYDGEQMERGRQIVALRRLGLSLLQVRAALAGETAALAGALSAHQAALDRQLRQLAEAAEATRRLRAQLGEAGGNVAALVGSLAGPAPAPALGFALPWPWAGEWFELARLAPVTYLVGPLGSGKTRLAEAIAKAVPGGCFVGLDRTADTDLPGQGRNMLDWLVEDGATASAALVALVARLGDVAGGPLVVDYVEQGLDRASQEALAAWLRLRSSADAPLVVMTRSSSILDLAHVPPDHAILFCPANHSPPVQVLPFAGAVGYEALSSCLATPEVRERTAGVAAVMPQSVRVNNPG